MQIGKQRIEVNDNKSQSMNIDHTSSPLYIDFCQYQLIEKFIDYQFSRSVRRAWHMVKYWLGYWIIFWTVFLDNFFCSLSVLRRGERQTCYWGRSGGRTISTQEGVRGGCISKCYWLIEFLVNHKNSFEWFFHWLFLCQKFCAGS